MRMISSAWVLLALAFSVPAVSVAHKSPPVEASMLVTGTVHIAPNGNVTSYSLDQPTKLPPAIKSLIAKVVPVWTFVPVLRDGKRMPGVSRMHLRVVAKPVPDNKYALSVAGTWFGTAHTDTAVRIRFANRHAPTYPLNARRAHMEGTVYLLIRVNRQGRAEKVAAEQVNLRELDSSYAMKRFRHEFALATERAARDWTFTLPTSGPQAAADHWDVQIPVSFTISNRRHAPPPKLAYGKWQTYVPGPQHIPAWEDSGKQPAGGIDALPDNTLIAVQQTRQLKTPLTGG